MRSSNKKFNDDDFSDQFTMIGLLGAIMTQAIVDAYKGNKKQREEALLFFRSKEYLETVVGGFRDFRVKFSEFFEGCDGSFVTVADIIQQGGAERLYRACRAVPLVEGGIQKKHLFILKDKKLAPAPAHGVKGMATSKPLQIAI